MKFSKVLVSMVVGLAAVSANAALRLEVAPLQLKASVKAAGVGIGVNGAAAIAYTGRTASKIAKGVAKGTIKVAGATANAASTTAFAAFDASKYMIVATGSEATNLVRNTYDSATDAGKTLLATGGAFGKGALNLADDVLSGTVQVLSLNPVGGAITIGKGVTAAAGGTVNLVVGTSASLVKSGVNVATGVVDAGLNTLGIAAKGAERAASGSSGSSW